MKVLSSSRKGSRHREFEEWLFGHPELSTTQALFPQTHLPGQAYFLLELMSHVLLLYPSLAHRGASLLATPRPSPQHPPWTGEHLSRPVGHSPEGSPVSPRSRAPGGSHLAGAAPVLLSSWSKLGLSAPGSEGLLRSSSRPDPVSAGSPALPSSHSQLFSTFISPRFSSLVEKVLTEALVDFPAVPSLSLSFSLSVSPCEICTCVL